MPPGSVAPGSASASKSNGPPSSVTEMKVNELRGRGIPCRHLSLQ